MRVARDHQVEPRSRRIEIEVAKVVDDIGRPPPSVTSSHAGRSRAQAWVSTLPRIAVTGAISANRGTISGLPMSPAVDDVLGAGQSVQRLGSEQAISIGDDTYQHFTRGSFGHRWIHISSATPRLAAKASIGVR